MSVQEVLELASELSREDRNLLCARLNEQLAADFAPGEVAEIKQAVAEADAEFERGEGIPAAEFFKKIGV